MGIALVRSAPADASLGYMSVRFMQGSHIGNIERFHVNTVDAAMITSEFSALAGFLQPFYDASWNIALTALTHNTGGVLERIAVPTAAGGGYLQHDGTSAVPTSGAQGYIQTILNFRTVNNGRARVALVGVGGQDIQLDGAVDANPAGSNLEKLVNYLVNTSTHIIAHDGTKLVLPCHVTYALKSRARRATMRVA